MDSLNCDQDRSVRNVSSPAAHRFIATDSPQFHAAEPHLASAKRIRLVVVHPNSIVRYGIHHAFSTSSSVHVSGVAGSWDQLRLNSVAEHAQVGLFGLPVGDESDLGQAFDQFRSIVACNPEIKWIVMANQHDAVCRDEAMRAGAIGYLESDYTVDRLESMIQWVAVGRQVGFKVAKPLSNTVASVSGSVSDSVSNPSARSDAGLDQPDLLLEAKQPTRSALPSHASGSLIDVLSQREREVLDGLAIGKTNQQIADSLFLSVKTIETYRSRLKQKLGLKDRAEMIAYLHEFELRA